MAIFNEPTTRKLSEQELADYVADPNHCPFCKGLDISAGGFEDGSYQEVNCNICGELWYDVYTLTSVEPVYTEKDLK